MGRIFEDFEYLLFGCFYFNSHNVRSRGHNRRDAPVSQRKSALDNVFFYMQNFAALRAFSYHVLDFLFSDSVFAVFYPKDFRAEGC